MKKDRQYFSAGTRSINPMILVLALGFCCSCATHVQNMPKKTANPPPATAFSSFRLIKLSPVTLAKEYAGHQANQRAHKKIQENLNAHFSGMLQTWNTTPREVMYDTLVIEPRIVEIKFVSGGARFMVGAMAGSSVVVMHVDYKDATSGNLISHAEFYQKANAMGGSVTVGGTDNDMLKRITDLIAEFTRNNFTQAIGGPTGAES